jgi:hypothetical protein
MLAALVVEGVVDSDVGVVEDGVLCRDAMTAEAFASRARSRSWPGLNASPVSGS